MLDGFHPDNTTLPENGDANAEVGKIIINPLHSGPKIVSEGLGEKLWEFDARGDIKSPRYWFRLNSLHWFSAGKKLYAINGQTGAKIWEFSANDSITLRRNRTEWNYLFLLQEHQWPFMATGKSL